MKRRNRLLSIAAGILAAVMVLSLALAVLPSVSAAKSSSELKSELSSLKDDAAAIKKQQEELKKKQEQNASDTLSIVEQKSNIDQQIKLIHDEIDNTNEQIQSYNLLIAEKQDELDQARDRQSELNEKYKLRLRSMEESGYVTYWSVLFKSRSFADLLDNINMINEIAAADQAMLKQLEQISQTIAAAQAELADEKSGLEEVKAGLADQQKELDAKREESDALLIELKKNADEMDKLEEEYERQESELTDEIAQKEKEYTEARRREQEANNGGSNGGNNGGGNNGGSAPNSGGFIRPVSGGYVTSAYGWRTHPIKGTRSFHSGVDIGVPQGTPIYASKSGTVTSATYSSAYGYYVTINHGDGFSTLYGHMTHYIVSAGDTVTQGQVIGYVGSTGLSTGPHLHFTVYYGGSTVNPMSYVPI